MRISLTLIWGLLIIGCSSPKSDIPPFGEGSQYPHLIKSDNGELIVSWFEPINSTTFGLYWSEWNKDKWTRKSLIHASIDFFVNWADFPSIFHGGGDTLFVHWLQKSSQETFDYNVMMAFSNNRGNSWSNPFMVNQDGGKKGEHGFLSFYKQKKGVGLTWLDGRHMGKYDIKTHTMGDMAVYQTSFINGKLGKETKLDSRVCECCPTSAIQVNNVSIIAYRDRSDSEIRNINIIRNSNGTWEKAFPVFEDNWMIPGCPVNGPKLAEKEGNVAIAWFTAPDGDAQINVAFSNDVGKTFSDPIRVDGGAPQGRVDLVWVNDNTVIASWLESDEDNSSIVYRIINTNGKLSEIMTIETLGGGRGIGYPQMEIVDDKLLFLWTNPLGKSNVKLKWNKI
ncbi:MAG: exo-alpha-sialidase [Candidatus Marinimicrobia bacterium]|jgi:hypothetical protein|nr:exo-alpha-sialidase [Candidatus Neomarinimicrobiota bacterium]MBT3501810.1 exo-alpha-sialidase [Candidatus Neomarinimicrobiota bacterium]MBT3838494.1 exo-alpha-sialidase [Candidatus Neomarinimicrobiota bacterium]MBT3999579.1 exo-alpha-sialidase [Candidatus Neomarinimicrobiota bacterium]MBT4283352.1 exo-alpha-sialidase [Candidatus Neomarinimicrobiota bacterium]